MPANSREYVITRPACSAVPGGGPGGGLPGLQRFVRRGVLAAVYPACSAVSGEGGLVAVYPACSAVPGGGVLAAVYPACSALSGGGSWRR